VHRKRAGHDASVTSVRSAVTGGTMPRLSGDDHSTHVDESASLREAATARPSAVASTPLVIVAAPVVT
jgi:hypothetical protein